jgi:hypothetical protein
MKIANKIIISMTAVLGLGVMGALVHAQSGPMGNGMGPGMMRGAQGQQAGPKVANWKIMRDLMTPAERLELMDKLIDANTIEEHQAIMRATRIELEKRAKEKGVTLPTGFGPMMYGRNCR